MPRVGSEMSSGGTNESAGGAMLDTGGVGVVRVKVGKLRGCWEGGMGVLQRSEAQHRWIWRGQEIEIKHKLSDL